VVLPEPEGPSSAKNSPSAISSETPSTALTSPNRRLTSRKATAGAGGTGEAAGIGTPAAVPRYLPPRTAM
jgi:hypothetical protein